MNRYSSQIRVRIGECGPDGSVSPVALLHWIQDLAEEHASSLNCGYQFCREHGLAWVMFRLSVQVHRAPRWREFVTATTWTYPAGPLAAWRDFVVCDVQGQALVESTCQWVLLDARRRRPVVLKKYLVDFPQGSFSPLVSVADKLWEAPVDDEPVCQIRASRSLVDLNGHINNSAYLVWALDSLPDDWENNRRLRSFSIVFRKESFAGENIDSHLQLIGSVSRHDLWSGGKSRAAVEIEWSGLEPR